MNSSLFLSLIIAHVIGDFYLQNDKYCNQKREKGIKSWFLYAHSIIIGVLSWLLVPISVFWLYALIIAGSHLIIDIIKIYSSNGLRSFIIDQLAHIGIIATISSMVNIDNLPIQMINCAESVSVPLLILIFLINMKPANILIKLILERYRVGESESCSNIRNAGALIGNLERILAIIFVIVGQYEAIGFIVAAKSILRFKDTDTAKTEYVLAGTFLSFGIAIICGLMVTIQVYSKHF